MDNDANELQSENEDAMEKVEKSENKRCFVCPTCPKKFYCKSNLRHHKLTHSGLKDNVCDICGKGFTRYHTLKLHKLRHSNEKPFKCEQCKNSFVTLECLRRHSRMHTGEMPYKCRYCDRTYAQSNDLIRHLRLHLGHEIYTCDLCPQSFRLKTELRKHFPEHKNDDAATREKHLAARQKKEKLLNLRLFSCPSKTNEEEETAEEIKDVEINSAPPIQDLIIKQEEEEDTEKLFEPYVAHEIIEETDDDLSGIHHKQKDAIKTEIDIEETQNDYNSITEFTIKSEIEISEDPAFCDTMSIKVESENSAAHIDDAKQSGSLQFAYSNNNMQIKSETESKSCERRCPSLSYCTSESPSAVPNNLNVSSSTIIPDLATKNPNNAELLTHTVGAQTTTCTFCGKYFRETYFLKRHIQSVHSAIDRPYACIYCSYRFKSLMQLNKHNTAAHNNRAAPASVNDLDGNAVEFACDECAFVLKNAAALTNHKNLHKTLTATQPKLSQKLHSLSCEECGDVFASRTKLQNHIRLHDEPNKNETCSSFSSMSEHESQNQNNSNTETFLVTILEPHTKDINTTNANADSLLLKPDPQFIDMNSSNADSFSVESDAESKNPNNSNTDSSLPSNTYGIKTACTICGKRFKKTYSLKRHMTSVHSSIDRPYGCTKCAYRFKSLVQLKAHDSAQHQNIFAPSTTDDKDDDYDDFVEKFDCDECSFVLSNAEALDKHKNIHYTLNATQQSELSAGIVSLSCNECGNIFATKKMLRNHKKSEHQNFVCTECGKQLSCKRSLRYHLFSMHKLMEHKNKTSTCMNDLDNFFDDFACNECSFVAYNANALTKHKAIHESLAATTADLADAVLSFSCEECGNAFSTENMLNNHKGHLHPYLDQPKKMKKTIIKPKSTEKVMCPDCGKYFSSNSVLGEHRKRHKHGRPYVCSICPMAFTNSSNLNHHMICHSGVKKHICDICGKGFTQSYSLKIHKRRHTNEKQFKCDQCELSFVVQATLDSHKRTHTGEKPYKCKYCAYAFAQSYDLRKHMRIHLGEEVYTCDFCPQGFRFATELRKHLMAHKNEDAATKERNLAARQEKEAKLNLKLYPFPMQNGNINDKRRIEKITT